MKYIVKKSRFTGRYIVLNVHTWIAQSSWATMMDARKTANDLNRSLS